MIPLATQHLRMKGIGYIHNVHRVHAQDTHTGYIQSPGYIGLHRIQLVDSRASTISTTLTLSSFHLDDLRIIFRVLRDYIVN